MPKTKKRRSRGGHSTPYCLKPGISIDLCTPTFIHMTTTVNLQVRRCWELLTKIWGNLLRQEQAPVRARVREADQYTLSCFCLTWRPLDWVCTRTVSLRLLARSLILLLMWSRSHSQVLSTPITTFLKLVQPPRPSCLHKRKCLLYLLLNQEAIAYMQLYSLVFTQSCTGQPQYRQHYHHTVD